MRGARLIRLFTEDVGTKVLSLVLAFLLWTSVSLLGTRTLTVQGVSVGLVNLREDLALTESLGTVDIRVRAPRSLLRQRDPRDLVRAFLDLASRGLGPQSGDVTVSPTDPRVDILAVLPPRLSFTLDPVVQRSLPVEVVPEGTPAAGFQVGEATVEPKTVTVRGALGKIQAAEAVEVRVRVEGATATLEGEYPFTSPEGLSVLDARARVKLVILQAEETRTLGVRVVTAGSPAVGSWARSVSADPPVVTVKGPRESLGDRTFLETVPVSIAEARAAITRAVDLALPDGVTVVGGSAQVRVTVDVAPLEGSKEVSATVQVGDLPEGLRVTTVSPGTVRVTVRGSGEAFDRLRDEDVRVVVSAGGKGAGTFSVRPLPEHVRAPSGGQVVSVEGVEVSVTLEST